MSAWPVAEEAYGERDPFTIEGKAKLVKDLDLQHYNALKFSLILCDFWALSFERMVTMLAAATGFNESPEQLEAAGERIFNMARQFNVREGFSKQDDCLPSRIFNDVLPLGATAGKLLPQEEFNKMLGQYYQIRGWDTNGVPTPSKLKELGLS